MADEKRIATRVSYGETLVELGAEHDDFLVFDADLAAATQTAKFKAAFPDRFYNAGIAEGNMMGLAAGVATTGRVAFASTFAMFADDVEARAATRCAYATDGPFYLRLGRLAAPVINDPENYEFELGRAIVMREGTDATVVACGLMVSAALEAADALAAEGISVEVVNMHTIKPLDEDTLLASAAKTGHVVTVEEHSVIGGLGEACAAVLCEKSPVPMRRVGVQDVYGESGPALELLDKYGLNAEGIAAAVREVLA